MAYSLTVAAGWKMFPDSMQKARLKQAGWVCMPELKMQVEFFIEALVTYLRTPELYGHGLLQGLILLVLELL